MAERMTQANARPLDLQSADHQDSLLQTAGAKRVLAPVYPSPGATSLSPALSGSAQQRRRTGKSSSEKFAALTSDMLVREPQPVLTRSDVIDYSGQRGAYAEPARVAVTFRMDCGEFQRLRKGAEKVGVKPRDVVNKAISACLDAYGVTPADVKPATQKR